MYCKFLKLTNGDDIIVTTDDTCDNLLKQEYILVHDPVVVQSIKLPLKNVIVESYVLQSWLKLSKREPIKIFSRNIVAVSEVLEKAELQYKSFVESYNKPDNELEISSEDNVEDTFDDFFESLEGPEEEDDETRAGSGTTVH